MRPGPTMVIDGAAIIAFATVGRLSHAEGVSLSGVLGVAWPFLVGGAVGTLLGRTWRRPESLSSGVWVWLGTLLGGMLLRALTGGGVQLSFVIVAGVTLAVFLLGWRGAYALIRRRGSTGRLSDRHDRNIASSSQ